MVHKKGKSKRIPLGKQYAIKKKIAEHHRKERREAKKNPNKRRKLHKDPGVPNLYPFKEQFVAKIEKMREEKLEGEETKRREKAKRRAENKSLTMEEYAAKIKRRDEEFSVREKTDFHSTSNRNNSNNSMDQDGTLTLSDLGEQSRRAFYREFKKVVETADVILEVLDARDPLGCRCPAVERMILAKDPNKRIVLVLNKIDLVPSDNAQSWIKHLRSEYPTVAFKSSTQKQKRNLGQSKAPKKVAEGDSISSNAIGAENLMQLLKNYSRNKDMKTSITVGVIGYPNVGKSSLINSLKRQRVVSTGATPGLTKNLQQITLDSHISLLDSPGIIFPEEIENSRNSEVSLILRNCVKPNEITDPIAIVKDILAKCDTLKMMSTYKIPQYETELEFLTQVGMKRGKLGKGGVIQYENVARSVLQDMGVGKISFFTVPPQRQMEEGKVVSSFAEEFKIEDQMEEGIWREAANEEDEEKFWMQLGTGELNERNWNWKEKVEEEEVKQKGMEVDAGQGKGKRKREENEKQQRKVEKKRERRRDRQREETTNKIGGVMTGMFSFDDFVADEDEEEDEVEEVEEVKMTDDKEAGDDDEDDEEEQEEDEDEEEDGDDDVFRVNEFAIRGRK